MNLPFGIPMMKENVIKKKANSVEGPAVREQMLIEYRDTLEYYKKCVLEYYCKLQEYDSKVKDHQLTLVQAALDLTYIKEQDAKILEHLAKNQSEASGNKTLEFLKELKDGPIEKTLHQLERIVADIIETNYKLDGMDKNVVNRMSELMMELQNQNSYLTRQLQMEVIPEIKTLPRFVNISRTLLRLVVFFNIIVVSALAFIILYTLKIIPF